MMKKDNYKTDFEESKKEIDLNKEKTLTRTELHGKVNQPKNTSAHKWPTILFYLFMLIPICILVMFIYNWSAGASKGELNPKEKAEESHFQFETNKNKPEKKVEPADEEEDAKSDQAKKDEAEAERVKKEQEEKERKAEAERVKKEQEEKEKQAEAERVRKEREEQEKQAEAERVKKEQEEQARQAEAERAKKAQEEKAKQAAAEKEKQEQAKKEENKPAAGSHTVAAGETLYRISVNYYGSGDAVEKIKQANGLSSNEIVTGQKLILP